MAKFKAGDFIRQEAAKVSDKALGAFEDEAIKAVTGVIDGTPIGLMDGGTLKANWQIGKATNNRVLKSPNKNKGRSFVTNKLKGKFLNKSKKDKRMFLFNNSPYANVVEFGGYPDPVKLGTWNKKTGRYEVRSKGGFSKQAPVGMLRINLLNFKNRLKTRFNRL